MGSTKCVQMAIVAWTLREGLIGEVVSLCVSLEMDGQKMAKTTIATQFWGQIRFAAFSFAVSLTSGYNNGYLNINLQEWRNKNGNR
jgi:hypothetical protein